MVSYLCEFIKQHNNWRELLKEKKINVKNKGNLYIFNYKIDADFNDPLVQESRGIILEIKDEPKVVCFPFRKFGNYQESYADTIDWSTAKVQEKVDGSIVKLYYYNNQWNWATNGNIDANDSPLAIDGYLSFMNLIKSANNYDEIMKYCKLDTDKTYIFELVSPHKTIVVKYAFTELIHIGTRNNITGQELDVDLGIKKPKMYEANSLESCIKLAETLNQENTIKYEGFVVVDANYNRIKVKSPEYLIWHHRLTINHLSKKDAIDIILSNKKDEFLESFPNYKSEILFYEWQISELMDTMNYVLNYGRVLYEEYSHDRKAVALTIKGKRFSDIVFKSLDNEKSIKEILGDNIISYLDKNIEDYVKINYN